MTQLQVAVENGILISPYGGRLVDLLVGDAENEKLIETWGNLPSIQISIRSQCDLELLATGAFSPLDSFMGKKDYLSVLDTMRLRDGTLFPIPITLPILDEVEIKVGQKVALRSAKFELLAFIEVREVYEWNLEREAKSIAGTTDSNHPLVAEMHAWGKRYIAGPIEVVKLPTNHDFRDLRTTPAEMRAKLRTIGNSDIVAFQTRNPMHRAHEELTKRATEDIGGTLLIHPVVGKTKPGDVDHFTRVRCYKALVENYFDKESTVLSLIPLAMRMVGPREALWHAIIRRNYGANYFIIGRNHACPGGGLDGSTFYGPYEAQKLMTEHEKEIGVKPYLSRELVYLPDKGKYEDVGKVEKGSEVLRISGTQIRENYLSTGKLLPEWYSRREIAELLSGVYPPKEKQGFCIWFTGLSGAGKSTIAEVLIDLLAQRGRQISTLDGDVVRTHLTKGLGFSKEDRDTNVRRIGFVASEIVKHNGAVLCAAISPYQSTRDEVQKMVGYGKFILVHVNTPISVCEKRDAKGLYARARNGDLKGFTGIDDPYEIPLNPNLSIETTKTSPAENAQIIIDYLTGVGFIAEMV